MTFEKYDKSRNIESKQLKEVETPKNASIALHLLLTPLVSLSSHSFLAEVGRDARIQVWCCWAWRRAHEN